ncbi:MAG: N-6 DNA methylase [Flavobacteriaceae bacterium]|nr:N-6 DNA methylase [Flavobacteriaceae bacterium]
MKKSLEEKLKSLIKQKDNEDNIKSDLRTILRDEYNQLMDAQWDLEKRPKGGNPSDITSIRLKTVIETKNKNKINLKKDKEQILGYLRDYAVQDNDSIIVKTENPLAHPWIGILTDGIQWACWRYEASGDCLSLVFALRSLTSPHQINRFITEQIFDRWKGYVPPKTPTYESLTSSFDTHFKSCKSLINKTYRKQSFKTKFILWSKLLKGSGILPDYQSSSFDIGDRDTQDLFCRHSFIVSVARLIIGYMDNYRLDEQKIESIIGDGFCGWLIESPDGKRIVHELLSDIKEYNWNRASKDILRELYHGLIDEKQRKEFGEFYTPDYLAQDVVNQVLDDDWCDQQITRAYNLIEGKSQDQTHLGVLDPSCGSGTFLLQVARRLLDRIKANHLEKRKLASKIIALLVYGIDVHPIAVEMSKATLRTALGSQKIEPHEYRICLGSALEEPTENSTFFGVKIDTAYENLSIDIPLKLYNHPNFAKASKMVNTAIVDNKKCPDINGIEKSNIQDFYDSLKEVIQKQGDHIWNWYILNRINIDRLISNKVSRLVGNPPWQVMNNAEETQRKDKIRVIGKVENIFNHVSPAGNLDLAAVFTARVTRLYLSKIQGKYGWVLPNSPIIGQAWKKWRDGKWANVHVSHEQMWNLTDIEPKIFPHSPNGCSVVLGKTVHGGASPLQHSHRAITKFYHYEDDYDSHNRKEVKTIASTSSFYFKSKKINDGLFYRPFCYYQVTQKKEVKPGLSEIVSSKGSKGLWKECGYDGVIETRALLPMISSKHLTKGRSKARLNYQPQMWLIAPLDRYGNLMLSSPDRARQYPHTHRYWEMCNEQYNERRKAKDKPRIEFRFNFNNQLKSHLRQIEPYGQLRLKVVYNASGNVLRAMRIPCNIIPNSQLYSIICDTEKEAQYLVGVINAPIMQDVWRASKTSKMHFHKSPFRAVDVPQFSPQNRIQT